MCYGGVKCVSVGCQACVRWVAGVLVGVRSVSGGDRFVSGGLRCVMVVSIVCQVF